MIKILIMSLATFMGVATWAGWSSAAWADSPFGCLERPPYSGKYESPEAEYRALTHWGAGAAFRHFALDAGFEFNYEQYMADCPNFPLFGYGLHLGRSCTEGYDVTTTYVSYFVVLNRAHERDPSNFREYFLKHAKQMDFDKYLTKTSALNQ